MDFNIEVRKKQLQSLDQYISSSKDKVQSILDCLGWSTEKVKTAEEQVICSFNKNHRIHPNSAVEHVKNCQINTEGYKLDDTFLSEPLNHAVQSITIDPFIKIQVLNKARSENPAFTVAWNGIDPDPRTSDRLCSTFSSHERLTLYDFCVQHTKGPPVPPEIHMMPKEDTKDPKTLSEGELRALERDVKRRQVKYKSVHTNHKTYTEVMKQVIENQMGTYEDWMKRSQEITACSDCETKYSEQSLQSPSTDDTKTQSRLDYQDDHLKDHPFPSSNNEKDGTFRSSESKPCIESENYEQSYAKYKRCRSPSEYSNTSSNKSRKRDVEDKHSRTSRNSSLDSLRSSHKYSEEKHKAKDHHQERDKEYRKYRDEKYRNYSNDDRGERKYRRMDGKFEKSFENQNMKSDRHKSEEKYKERNGREDSEYDRCRKDKDKYQHNYDKVDNKYERNNRNNDRHAKDREYKKYRDDKDRRKDKHEHSDYYFKMHENEDRYLQRKRLAPSYDSRNGKSLSRDKS